jgi:hypothetical protein
MDFSENVKGWHLVYEGSAYFLYECCVQINLFEETSTASCDSHIPKKFSREGVSSLAVHVLMWSSGLACWLIPDVSKEYASFKTLGIRPSVQLWKPPISLFLIIQPHCKAYCKEWCWMTVVLMAGWQRNDDWTVYFTGQFTSLDTLLHRPTDSSNESPFL